MRVDLLLKALKSLAVKEYGKYFSVSPESMDFT